MSSRWSELRTPARRSAIIARLLAVVALPLALAACESGQFDDLRAYVDQVKARQKGKVEPLPEVLPQNTFEYSATGLRDPFAPSMVQQTLADANGPGPRPDMGRKKEPLESIPLDSLRLAGSMQRGGERWAIVKTADGTLYRVKAGNYIGQNFGRIQQITETKITIRELIPNGMGGWEERIASLALSE